jgi:hypothetical protein
VGACVPVEITHDSGKSYNGKTVFGEVLPKTVFFIAARRILLRGLRQQEMMHDIPSG